MEDRVPTLMIKEMDRLHSINNLLTVVQHRHNMEANSMLHQQWDETNMPVSIRHL